MCTSNTNVKTTLPKKGVKIALLYFKTSQYFSLHVVSRNQTQPGRESGLLPNNTHLCLNIHTHNSIRAIVANSA